MSKDNKKVAPKAIKESKGMKKQLKRVQESGGMPPYKESQPAVHKTGTSKSPASHPTLVKARVRIPR